MLYPPIVSRTFTLQYPESEQALYCAAVYGQGLVKCSATLMRPWIAMQRLGLRCSSGLL